MPNARPAVIPIVCEWLSNKNTEEIKSVLDIGCGFGKWGFLARLYIQIWNHDLDKKEYQNWKEEMRVDAIEIFEDYITDLQRLIYNKIWIGNALDEIHKVGFYNLIIAGDVLEHLTFSDGSKLLEQMRKRSDWTIITMPDYFCAGGSIMGNSAEIHHYVWKDADFPGDPQIFRAGNQKVIIFKNEHPFRI